MAKKKATKKETKSEFLRKVLAKNPDLDHRQVNLRWAKTGHAGEISSPLYYKVRAELGIKTEWVWVREDAANPSQTVPAAGVKVTGEVYQVKVTLMDMEPPIWRRVQVSDCTLDKLHEYIQTAMGWTNSHLHHFRIDGREPLEENIVFPGVAEVVLVQHAPFLAALWHDVTEHRRGRVSILQFLEVLLHEHRVAVKLFANPEVVKVRVGPAHRRLDQFVQPV